MPRGGARPGAGRKAGSPNKASAERQAEVAASGLTPLDYMLTMLRNEGASPADRMWAAEKAAPYVHPKLAAVTHTGEDGGPIKTDSTHHIEGPVRPFAEFLTDALGRGAGDVSGGVGED